MSTIASDSAAASPPPPFNALLAQGAPVTEVDGDAEILLALCCGCTDGCPPCAYCCCRKKGQLIVQKFRQVPAKVYGNYTHPENTAVSMTCEVNFSTFRIHGACGSTPLVSLLDPIVELSHPPAGVKDPLIFSIARRNSGNVTDLWYLTAPTEEDARDWFALLKAHRPKRASSSCSRYMRVQRFLMQSQGVTLPGPDADVAVMKHDRGYWTAADRFAGNFLSRDFDLITHLHNPRCTSTPQFINAMQITCCPGLTSAVLKLTPWSSWAKAAHNIVYGLHLTSNLRYLVLYAVLAVPCVCSPVVLAIDEHAGRHCATTHTGTQ